MKAWNIYKWKDHWFIYYRDMTKMVDNQHTLLLPNGPRIGSLYADEYEQKIKLNPKYYCNSRRNAIQTLKKFYPEDKFTERGF